MARRRNSRSRLEAPDAEERRFPSGKKIGRPREEAAGVPHVRRQPLPPGLPLHVAMDLAEGLPSLRTPKALSVFLEAVAEGQDRFGVRITHYALRTRRLHMLLDVDPAEARPRAGAGSEVDVSEVVSQSMKGLKVRLARGWNRVWGRTGTVFCDRYQVLPVATPEHMRETFEELFCGPGTRGPFDAYSSAQVFDGWVGHKPTAAERKESVVLPARTDLVRKGWRRKGLLARKRGGK